MFHGTTPFSQPTLGSRNGTATPGVRGGGQGFKQQRALGLGDPPVKGPGLASPWVRTGTAGARGPTVLSLMASRGPQLPSFWRLGGGGLQPPNPPGRGSWRDPGAVCSLVCISPTRRECPPCNRPIFLAQRPALGAVSCRSAKMKALIATVSGCLTGLWISSSAGSKDYRITMG